MAGGMFRRPMEEKRFLIPVRRRWTLAILPLLAIFYFAAVITLAILRYEIRGVPTDALVLGGVAFFALVMIIQVPFLFTRRVKPEAPEDAAAAYPPESLEPAYAPPAAPMAPPRAAVDDEMLVTAEEKNGLRVLEYSAPAKSHHRGAVYAKAYVPVTKEHVMRVETLAAEGAEL